MILVELLVKYTISTILLILDDYNKPNPMKLLLFAIFSLSFFNQNFAQTSYSIEGKWKPEGFSNTLYILSGGLQYTYYCVNQNCDSVFNTYEAADGNHLPGPHDYTFDNDTLIIDMNFGNIFNSPIQFDCDGNIVQFLSNGSQWIRLNTNLNDCTSSGLTTEAIYEPIIYPNPANEQINISFETPIKGQISLLDLSGKVVLVEQFAGTNHALDLSGFNAGIYMLTIQTDLFSMQKKIVLEK